MKTPSTKNWARTLDEIEGLLFFAQRWDEMLFDYSMESHRFRTLNLPAICTELIRAYELCSMGFLAWGALIPLREELLAILDADKTAAEILGDRYLSLKRTISDWSSNCKKKEKLAYAASTIYQIIDKPLWCDLYKRLQVAVYDPRNKKDIDILSGRLLTELIRKGYSPQYLYGAIQRHFFTEREINTVTEFDRFFDNIDAQRKTFTVVFSYEKTGKLLAQNADRNYIACLNRLPVRIKGSQSEAGFFKLHKTSNIFLIFRKIDATDPYSARSEAESRLETAVSFVGFLKHKLTYEIPEYCLVYEETPTVSATMIRAPTKATLKRPDVREEMLEHSLGAILGPLINRDTEESTRHRLLGALRAHMAGTRAVVVEDQFSNLWTALETLIGSTIEDNTIKSLLDRCVPMLCLKYFQKLLRSISQDFRRCLENEYREIIKRHKNNETQQEFLLRFLVSDALQAERDKLSKICDRNPLLRNRLFRFGKVFKSPKRARAYLDSHEERVRWHLQRMYRARNALVHTGMSDHYLESLVVNLHSYVDHIFSEVVARLEEERHHSTLDKVYFECAIEYEGYKSRLCNLNESEAGEGMARRIVF